MAGFECLPAGVLDRVLAEVPRWRVQYAQLADDGEQCRTQFVPCPPLERVCVAFCASARRNEGTREMRARAK